MTTNYTSTFIAVAPDTKATAGIEPRPSTIAALQLAIVRNAPYRLTSDDLMFEAHAQRTDIGKERRAVERDLFVAKPRACLRASPLGKTCGWGIHHDELGRIAVYGVETDDYDRLRCDPRLSQTQAMRSKRG